MPSSRSNSTITETIANPFNRNSNRITSHLYSTRSYKITNTRSTLSLAQTQLTKMYMAFGNIPLIAQEDSRSDRSDLPKTKWLYVRDTVVDYFKTTATLRLLREYKGSEGYIYTLRIGVLDLNNARHCGFCFLNLHA